MKTTHKKKKNRGKIKMAINHSKNVPLIKSVRIGTRRTALQLTLTE